MRRRMAVLWLAVLLCLTGFAGPCLAQTGQPAPDIPLLTAKAQAGDIGAMTSLGAAYLDGNGVTRDLDVAIGWFAIAAQQGDVQATYFLSFALGERARPGDLDQALVFGKQALAWVKRRSGSGSTDAAAIHSHLGFIYRKLDRFGDAVASFEAARRLLERALGRDRLEVAEAYMNLSVSLGDAGRFSDALAMTETAVRLFTMRGDGHRAELASLYMNKGTYLQSLARYAEALDALETARSMRVKIEGDDSPGVARVLANVTAVHVALKRFNQAHDAAQKALSIYESARSSDTATISILHANLGVAYQGLGRYEEARAQYQAALEFDQRLYGPTSAEVMRQLIHLANVDDELKNFDDALAGYQKALVIARGRLGPVHAEVASILGSIGNTSRKMNRLNEALDSELQALLIQTGAADADLDNMRYTFRTLSQIFIAKGNKSAAIVFAKQAVNTHQAIRVQNAEFSGELRSALGTSFERNYRGLSQLLLAEGLFSEAQFVGGLLKQEEFFEFTGRAKTGFEPGNIRLTRTEEKFWSELKQLTSSNHKVAAEFLSPSDQEQLDDLNAKYDATAQAFVSAARALIDRSEVDRLARQKEALASGASYAERLQETLNAMGPGVVLLQAMSLDDGLHLFVSAAGRETKHRQVPVSRVELADQVFAAVSAVENRRDEASAKLAGLYDLLIKPVRSDLDTAANGASAPVLLLDLSGFLRYVPYAALYDGRHYLVEDFALALYNPAIPTRFIALNRNKIKGAGFGVTHALSGFSALPGVRQELDAVFRIVGGTPRVDDAFNESSFAKALTAKPQILHIASHFRFRPGNETNSYLLLGNGDGLTLNELRTQKRFRFRGVDLLTLSACETARGGGAEGEEIESFGALAQVNGASAVMSTLWQIADSSTAKLMTNFYDGLVNQGLDKAHALRQAQIAMIRGGAPQAVALQSSRSMSVVEDGSGPASAELPPTSHPYYWAAFILMGNWM